MLTSSCEWGLLFTTDPRTEAQDRPRSLLHRGTGAQRRLGGRPAAAWSALWVGPWGAFSAPGRWGQGVGADTPPAVPRAPGRGRPPPAHAPPRAGQAPSRRRAAAGGGSGPRFLSPGLRASSQRSPGQAELGRRRRHRRRPPAPAPPRTLPGGPAGVGSERGDRPAAPPSGPSPGQRSLPPQPACGRQSLRGVERGEPPRPPIQRPGQPPAAGATFQTRTSVAAFGSGTLPGPRRLHCFLPPTPSRPPSPAFLPSPTRAARPSPCLCLAVPPPPLFAPIPLCTAPPGDPCAPPHPPGRMDRPAGR